MEKVHHLINEVYIVYVPRFKLDGSLYPDIVEATDSMIKQHHAVGKQHECDKYI